MRTSSRTQKYRKKCTICQCFKCYRYSHGMIKREVDQVTARHHHRNIGTRQQTEHNFWQPKHSTSLTHSFLNLHSVQKLSRNGNLIENIESPLQFNLTSESLIKESSTLKDLSDSRFSARLALQSIVSTRPQLIPSGFPEKMVDVSINTIKQPLSA